MINSRSVNDLYPKVKEMCETHQAAFLAATGHELLVTCTFRDGESQHLLFSKGRKQLDSGAWIKVGAVVTNADAGFSFHQYHVAYDVVPLAGGKPVWTTTTEEDILLWNEAIRTGEEAGLESASKWKSFPEKPHFQFTFGLTVHELYAAGNVEAALSAKGAVA